jgi:uncharacterized RDD family membrane protein YckC
MTSTDSSRYGSGAASGASLASLGSRLVAQIIDGVIGVMPFLLFVVMAKVNDVLAGAAVLTLFLFFAYYLFCDGLPNGQSVGKRLLKIRVVIDETGLPCTYWKSFLRNIAQVLGILDWLWIFGGKRKRAGDFLAHTSVVSA